MLGWAMNGAMRWRMNHIYMYISFSHLLPDLLQLRIVVHPAARPNDGGNCGDQVGRAELGALYQPYPLVEELAHEGEDLEGLHVVVLAYQSLRQDPGLLLLPTLKKL